MNQELRVERTILKKGNITIPKDIRELTGIVSLSKVVLIPEKGKITIKLLENSS